MDSIRFAACTYNHVFMVSLNVARRFRSWRARGRGSLCSEQAGGASQLAGAAYGDALIQLTMFGSVLSSTWMRAFRMSKT